MIPCSLCHLQLRVSIFKQVFLCDAATLVSSNLTSAKELVCSEENVDRCGLVSTSRSGLEEILCNGVSDCFGGIDEASCENLTLHSNKKLLTTSELYNACGMQPETGHHGPSVYPVRTKVTVNHNKNGTISRVVHESFYQ